VEVDGTGLTSGGRQGKRPADDAAGLGDAEATGEGHLQFGDERLDVELVGKEGPHVQVTAAAAVAERPSLQLRDVGTGSYLAVDTPLKDGVAGRVEVQLSCRCYGQWRGRAGVDDRAGMGKPHMALQV
jgi:hypothetical protein